VRRQSKKIGKNREVKQLWSLFLKWGSIIDRVKNVGYKVSI
jgi:hypothetical protein